MFYFLKRIITYFNFIKSLFATNIKLLWGMWKLTKLPQPAITFFGGSKMPKDCIHAKRATSLAEKLTQAGFSIITGGGPGIMEAANKGAYEVAKKRGVSKWKGPKSLGISLTSFSREVRNPYVHDTILMKHFFARKWLLVRHSIGFVVFPGGFGTLDELFEVLTLVQTHKMPKLPIILMGKNYWEPIAEWITEKALKNKLITQKDLELIHITSSVEEAEEIILKYCKSGKKEPKPIYKAKPKE
jgi:uncharacterized protein (TIGR00730 family)